MNDFHKRLAQTIRDVGEELIEQAEDISGTNPMLSSITIKIYFDPEYNMLNPTIEVNVEKRRKVMITLYIIGILFLIWLAQLVWWHIYYDDEMD